MAPRRTPVEEVIDLRDPQVDEARAAPVVLLLASPGATDPEVFIPPMRAALDDKAAIEELRSHDDPVLRAWGDLLAETVPVLRPSRYVGSFRKTMARAAAVAQALPATEHQLAASFLVALSCEFAEGEHDYRHGVSAASRIDRTLGGPSTAVERILRPALAYHRVSDTTVVGYAFKLVLEIMARSGGPHLLPRDFWPIRAAAVRLTGEERALLHDLARALHKADRSRLNELLEPPRRRRRTSWGALSRR